jgi:hypothetical protein
VNARVGPWGRLTLLLVLAASLSALPGCIAGQPGATCDEMIPSYIPQGFDRVESGLDGEAPSGVLVVYRDASGMREISFLSGVPSDPHGVAATGETLVIRGHRAVVLFDPGTNTRAAMWMEAAAGDPCGPYSFATVGLARSEFARIAAGIS